MQLLLVAILSVGLPLSAHADEYLRGNCIDFTDLTNPDVCVCYTGTVHDPMARVAVVDNGPANITSRHTVHTSRNETDARTGNGLLTVPAGDSVSVRLGNWENGAQAEAIEYLYTPSSADGDLLILKYAVVLANPNSGHTATEKPGFSLQILDADGHPISGNTGCYDADFTAGENATSANGWHKSNYSYEKNREVKHTEVLWKDWTTVFFPLHDYVGQQIRIRLITKDCAHVSHFGYAYFTVHCEGTKLRGISCGSMNTHFEAPEGYAYLWYKKSDPNEVLRNTDGSRKTVDQAAFDINLGDTAVYCVNVYSETGCYISLEADPNVQIPEAHVYETSRVVENCGYTLTFADTSFIRIVKAGEEYRSSVDADPNNDIVWLWGDNTADVSDMSPSVSHVYEPGDYTLRTIVRIAGGCEDTAVLQLHLPYLKMTMEAEAEYSICPEDSFRIVCRTGGSGYDSLVVESRAAAVAAGFARRYIFLPGADDDGLLQIPVPGADGALDATIRVGEYEFMLRPYARDVDCGVPEPQLLKLHVNYSAGSIVQRGSYLFLYDERHNGGYDWTGSTFQWYLDGEALSGKTSSQLLMPDAAPGAELYCVITDAAGISIPTCPVVYDAPRFSSLETAETARPTAVVLQPGERLQISDMQHAMLYDAAGRLLQMAASEDGLLTIMAPSTAGMYILKSGERSLRIMVRL